MHLEGAGQKLDETTFENKCSILSEIWEGYREFDDLKDFVEFNDLGLPLARFIQMNLIEPNEKIIPIINEAFESLLTTLSIEDSVFEELEELLDESEAMANMED